MNLGSARDKNKKFEQIVQKSEHRGETVCNKEIFAGFKKGPG